MSLAQIKVKLAVGLNSPSNILEGGMIYSFEVCWLLRGFFINRIKWAVRHTPGLTLKEAVDLQRHLAVSWLDGVLVYIMFSLPLMIPLLISKVSLITYLQVVWHPLTMVSCSNIAPYYSRPTRSLRDGLQSCDHFSGDCLKKYVFAQSRV